MATNPFSRFFTPRARSPLVSSALAQGSVAASLTPATSSRSAENVLAASAAQPVANEPASEDNRLAVITAHSDSRFAAVLVGVSGKLTAEGKFKIDPIYKPVSSLFELMDADVSTDRPVDGFGIQRGTEFIELNLDNHAQVRALQMNLLQKQVGRWGDMYAKALPAGVADSDIGRVMLDAERRKAVKAVEDLRALFGVEVGLREFLVPIKVEVHTHDAFLDAQGAANQTRDALLSQCLVLSLSVRLDRERQAIEDMPIQHENDVAPELAAHIGSATLMMSSWIKVLASNETDAMKIADAVFEVSGPLQNALLSDDRFVHGSIDGFDLTPRSTTSDDDEDFESGYQHDRYR